MPEVRSALGNPDDAIGSIASYIQSTGCPAAALKGLT
jgi:hypothetical protein